MRIYREPQSLTVYVGPWACRINWGDARFSNGRRFFSGWHRWKDQP